MECWYCLALVIWQCSVDQSELVTFLGKAYILRLGGPLPAIFVLSDA